MTYPLSNPVTAGQPTAADHYNNLRSDALYLGNDPVNSKALGTYLARQAQNLDIQKITNTRVRIPYNSSRPAAVVINGCLLRAAANIDLPSNSISGLPQTFYIFAVRVEGSSSFGIIANTSATESTDQLLIGELFFDGTTLGYIRCYFMPNKFPDADYDSGWFSVTAGGTYTRSHGCGSTPSLITLYWSASSSGAGTVVLVTMVWTTDVTAGVYDPVYSDDTNVIAKPGSNASYDATCHSRYASSASGYWRIRCYK